MTPIGRHNRIGISSPAVVTLLVMLLVSSVPAQSGGNYILEWSTIDGGGGVSMGGQYVVEGTIGQPDAAYSAGGPYEVLGGFWSGGPECLVNFHHFATFAEHWLDTGCADPDWCGGADLDHLGSVVDELDLKILVEQWLYYCPYRWQLK
jgi:hypothetical protein